MEIDPSKGPKPVAVLIQTDPWLDVIGSDTPMVAIYDDGQIVYEKREKGKASTLLHKQLSQEALAEMKRKLIAFGDYWALKDYYNVAPNVFDEPETQFYLSLNGKEFVAGVYGLETPDTELPASIAIDSEDKPDKLPKALADLHAYLTSLDFADAKPWKPPYVEVMLWEFGRASQTIPWPKDWPGLESPNARKRGSAYSIFLPGQELPKLRDFLKTQDAVEINGKKWAVSFRFAFPSEPVWWKAFDKKSEKARAGKPNDSRGRQ